MLTTSTIIQHTVTDKNSSLRNHEIRISEAELKLQECTTLKKFYSQNKNIRSKLEDLWFFQILKLSLSRHYSISRFLRRLDKGLPNNEIIMKINYKSIGLEADSLNILLLHGWDGMDLVFGTFQVISCLKKEESAQNQVQKRK